MMSKKLVLLLDSLPKTLSHGRYNVRFYDGIDLPFNVGPERWRSIEGTGFISFDNPNSNPINTISLDLINHPISDSTSSAYIRVYLNNKVLVEKPSILKISQRSTLDFEINPLDLRPKNNQLRVEVNYDNQTNPSKQKQILGLMGMQVNNEAVNLESVDVPYVSELGPKVAGVHYYNWGALNKDPWRLWSLHTQVYERTPDFWWVKPLYYWDFPKKLILTLFGLNVLGVIFFANKLKRSI